MSYILYDRVLFYFFFFQAEDGIRDLTVTGVQTCALPISHACSRSLCWPAWRAAHRPAAARHRRGAPTVAGSASLSASIPKTSSWFQGAALCRAAECRFVRSEEHTSELQSQSNLVCRLLLE